MQRTKQSVCTWRFWNALLSEIMNKKELQILGDVFESEIKYALKESICPLYQPRGAAKTRMCEKLKEDGYLKYQEITLPGRFPIIIKGYGQTILGNMAYCMSDECADEAS